MSITNFYKNQEIFITGGSGFVGKALIEKLLRCFPKIGKIFVLIRSKKGKSANERLQEILKTTLFERAQNEQPQAFSKFFAIDGDCQELKLGISTEDLEKMKTVSLIFHAAASVRFDDDLKSAILLNTRGTHELVKFATSLKHLKAFIHISTAYSNPNKLIVEERIYPAYVNWRTAVKLAETYDVETLNIFLSKYSSAQPNTYTFSKGLAEHVINDYCHQLPVMVVRPSIVTSSIEEPVSGWIDNFNGPIGMLVACGIGIMRTYHGNPDNVLDIIPVDITVRGLLIAAYKLATGQSNAKEISNSNEVEVINCVNDTINSMSISEILNRCKVLIRKNPFENCVWLPEGSETRYAAWHYIRLFTFQIGLAVIVDAILRLTKQKPFLLRLQRTIHAAGIAVYFFINRDWIFRNKKFLELEELIPPDDNKKLGFVRYLKINRDEFLSNGIKGAKQFLLHESPEASTSTKMRFKILFALHYLILSVAVLLFGKMLICYLQAHCWK